MRTKVCLFLLRRVRRGYDPFLCWYIGKLLSRRCSSSSLILYLCIANIILDVQARIVILGLNTSWGLLEEQLNYRIMFSRYSPLIAYSLWKYGKKTVVFSLHTEHLQGWPWVLGFLDKLSVTSLLLSVAWGVDPFPELAKGRATTFLLWVSAFGELYALVHLLHITVTRKSWIVVGHRGARCCCCKGVIPWPFTMTEKAYDATMKAREDAKKARDHTGEVEMKGAV